MTKIKFIKETPMYKVGDIVEVKEAEALEIVRTGYAINLNELEWVDQIAEICRIHDIYLNKKSWEKLEAFGNEYFKVLLFKLQEFVQSSEDQDTLTVKGIRFYVEKKNLKQRTPEDIPLKEVKENFSKSLMVFTDKLEMARNFIDRIPIFYDKNKIWWAWNDTRYRWERCDETDLMILITENVNTDTVNATERSEILESLKQVGRRKIPKQIKKSWVQFKGKIIDINTGQIIQATPDYFIMNPIDWEIGESEDTPTMDKIFEEWVGTEYVQTLYEIIAYCLLPDYPIHRVFCLVGRGRNGKSKFLRLLTNFLGKQNTCSSSLDKILNSRFESFKLYKKLVCLMGETNFNELSDSDTFKRLTGGDEMGFEIKGKDPFDDYNYAKIVIATNSLPETKDKTEGFYSRWQIIDFPNQFSESKDILQDIPEEEYRSLANKAIKILQRLIKERSFKNEGSISHRIKRYEEKSNPLQNFLEEETVKDPDGWIFKYEFKDRFLDWLKDRGLRIWNETELGRKMKDKFEDGQRGEKFYRAWLGVRFKSKIEDFRAKTQGSQGSHPSYNSFSRIGASKSMPVNPVNPVNEIKNIIETPIIFCSNCQIKLNFGEFHQRGTLFLCPPCLQNYEKSRSSL